MSLRCGLPASNSSYIIPLSKMDDRQYQKKFQRMRQQHEIEKQVLMAEFQYQTSSLHQHHEYQLQQHLKMVLSKQRVEQIDPVKVEQNDELTQIVKNKDKSKGSAVASTAVKRRLQNFVIGRQKIKMDHNDVERHRNIRWNPLVDEIDDGPETSYQNSYYDKCNDFPLRKTASEPNLKVRSRLKQKLSLDQRSSPLLNRKRDVKVDLANRIKKKLNSENISDPKTISNMTSTANTTTALGGSYDASLPVLLPQMEANFSDLKLCKAPGTLGSNDLYTSPSLPNISIGMSAKPSDLKSNEAESSRLVLRTSSFPGPLVKLPTKKPLSKSLTDHEVRDLKSDSILHSEQIPFFPIYASPLYGTEATSNSSPLGPIRPSASTRPHKALIRTHSAPTTATSQLQQHLLMRKHNRSLKQQYDQRVYKRPSSREAIAAHPNLLTMHEESEYEKNNFCLRFDKNFLSDLNSVGDVDAMMSYKPMNVHPPSLINSALIPRSDVPLHVASNQMDEITNSKPTRNPHFSTKDLSAISHKPLQRTKSSPAASFIKMLPVCKKYRYTTGIAYSPVMLRHGCACGDDHIEHSGRLRAIWERLTRCGLIGDDADSPCELLEARKATTDELQLVHTKEHTLRYGTTSLARKELDLGSKFIVLPCGGVGVDNGIDIDTVWNELETINAARMAVGCTVDLTLMVARDQLKNGFALVRPPGHHAQKNLAMAFCYFNAVAVAARKLQSSGVAERILIIDWDIHHCNGTQNIFYNDPSVLVISVHRYDDGNFFPGTGALEEVGADEGTGFNVNIGFSGDADPPFGDSEYLAVFRSIVMPISLQFSPDLVLVSSGFSAARGHAHTLGGYAVTPQCFGYLTHLLCQLAKGKVVMVLEGGFVLDALCDCTEACVRTLLGESEYAVLPETSLNRRPQDCAIKTINTVIRIQGNHWKNLTSDVACVSHNEWITAAKENETCNAFASLSMKPRHVDRSSSQRQETIISNQPERMCTSDDQTDNLPLNCGNDRNSHDTCDSSESSPLDVVGTPPPSSPDCMQISSRNDENEIGHLIKDETR